MNVQIQCEYRNEMADRAIFFLYIFTGRCVRPSIESDIFNDELGQFQYACECVFYTYIHICHTTYLISDLFQLTTIDLYIIYNFSLAFHTNLHKTCALYMIH